jgi:peptide/nickel transport system ATP-binding protein
MSKPPLLQLKDLHVQVRTAHGLVEAVRGVSFSLERGDTVGLMGESGCGKSLTALALMGLLPEGAQARGSLQWQGEECMTWPEENWCKLRGNRWAMIFQEPMTALNPLHTVGDQVAEPLRLHRGLSRKAALSEAADLLDRVGIAMARQRLHDHPHQFSGGQRQRIMIAMALSCNPDLLIADEPTTALDVTVAQRILELMQSLVQERGMGLLLISHDLGVLARQVQQLKVMYAGQIVEQGPTAEVLTTPAHPYTRGLLASRPQWLRAPQEASQRMRLPTLPGQVPELHQLGQGCAFADRCSLVDDACRTSAPPSIRLSPSRQAQCWRLS